MCQYDIANSQNHMVCKKGQKCKNRTISGQESAIEVLIKPLALVGVPINAMIAEL